MLNKLQMMQKDHKDYNIFKGMSSEKKMLRVFWINWKNDEKMFLLFLV